MIDRLGSVRRRLGGFDRIAGLDHRGGLDRPDGRAVATGVLVAAGLAIVAGGSIAAGGPGASSGWILAVLAATLVAGGSWLVGHGIVGVVVAQIAVAAADPPTLARIAALESGVALVAIGTLTRGGLRIRSTVAAIATAALAGVAVGAALQVASLAVVVAAAGLAAALIATLLYRISRVTIEGDPA